MTNSRGFDTIRLWLLHYVHSTPRPDVSRLPSPVQETFNVAGIRVSAGEFETHDVAATAAETVGRGRGERGSDVASFSNICIRAASSALLPEKTKTKRKERSHIVIALRLLTPAHRPLALNHRERHARDALLLRLRAHPFHLLLQLPSLQPLARRVSGRKDARARGVPREQADVADVLADLEARVEERGEQGELRALLPDEVGFGEQPVRAQGGADVAVEGAVFFCERELACLFVF